MNSTAVDEVSIRPLEQGMTGLLAEAAPGWAAAVPAWLESMRTGRSMVLVALRGAAPVGVAQLLHGEVLEVCNVGEQVTTTYEYVDEAGMPRTATETDEWMEKDLG